jgi:hypothetical protein
MAQDRLDQIVLEARRNAEKREAGYRAQALKLFPWVCGRCARAFDSSNLQLLEVHHKNSNHHDNPPDGSNWELLCTYCTSTSIPSQGMVDVRPWERSGASTHNPLPN